MSTQLITISQWIDNRPISLKKPPRLQFRRSAKKPKRPRLNTLCAAHRSAVVGGCQTCAMEIRLRGWGGSATLWCMGMLDAVAGRVAAGATVEFRPSGSSMVPLIRSRDAVVVAPVDPSKLEVGDIVLARVAGTVYLHLVSSLDRTRNRVQISNNRGRVNGWTSHDRVFGICVAVDGVPRAGSANKVRAAAANAQPPSGSGGASSCR